MEERTLIKQGGGGYTIYVPKKWITAKGLKEKDSVFIEEKNGLLLIQAKPKKKKQVKLIFDETNKHDIRTLLTHFYREGCEEVKCEGVDAATFSKIITIVNQHLLGFEIIERDENSCVIGNISEPTDQKYDLILRRIFLIAQETISIIHEDAKSNKFSKMTEVQDMRDQIDKFILFCRRIVVKEQLEHNETLSWEMLTFLNHIQHAAYYLYKYLHEHPTKLKAQTIDFLREARDQFELFRVAYYKKSLPAIHEINKRKVAYQTGACIKALEKSIGHEGVALSYIRELLRLIQIGTSPLISMVLEEQLNPLNES
jgi:phosphate uptake regulator